jgi:serine phosphatase RsbU (regulator of sigma subunit)
LKRRRLSLETRLAVLTSAVLVLASSALFIGLAARERTNLIAAKARAASMVVQLLANEIAPAIDFGDLDEVASSLNYLRANSDIVGAGVWAKGGSDAPITAWTSPGAPVAVSPTASETDGVATSPESLVVTRTVRGQREKELATVRVVFTLARENEAFRSNRRQLFAMTTALTAIVALGLGLLARRYVVGPIKRLSLAATALAEGDLSARVAVRSDDEIGDLAIAFNTMSGAVAFREERLQKEIELAQRIQTSILPQSLNVPGLELAAIMIPTTQVGGDYYDVLPLERGCWIGIGDVSGHGLDAGLIMLMIQSIVASLVARDPAAAPKDVVCVLNQVLFDNIRGRLRRDHHATLTILSYDQSGMVTFAGAHEDIVVLRDLEKSCEIITTPGTWVGGRYDIRSVTRDSRIQLHRGDLLLLHSDGATELRNRGGEPFGIERLCAALERVRAEPTSKIQESLVEAVGQWGIPDDDVTLLVARYVGV